MDLEIYIEGSLSVFSAKTNVDITKRLVIYDIKDLGKQLKTMGMLIVLDQVWNRITENRERGVRTWLYIDEMQLLFTNEYSENYFLNYGVGQENGGHSNRDYSECGDIAAIGSCTKNVV